jgi:hypothetical protein
MFLNSKRAKYRSKHSSHHLTYVKTAGTAAKAFPAPMMLGPRIYEWIYEYRYDGMYFSANTDL